MSMPVGVALALLIVAIPGLVAVLAGPVAEPTERAVRSEVVVPAGVGEAWAAWTTRDVIRSFLAPDARVEARAGGAFEIIFDPSAAPGERGADSMRFLAMQPKRMLSFDWNAPPHLPAVRKQRTFVTVRFAPVSARQTRVALHHTGWGEGGEWDQAHDYFDRAWGRVLQNLARRLAEGPVERDEPIAQRRSDAERPLLRRIE
jgi:uncharacterized protein YndB with AHSA1/START domain